MGDFIMIIDVEKIEKLLADESISAYEIESKTGVNRTILAKLRRGEADLDNMTLKNLKKIMKYIKMEESKMEITKYELRMATAEVKKEELHEGITQEQNDIMSEIVKEFDNLEDAKAALAEYESSVYDLGHGKYEVTEYYVEINEYEVIDGEEYIKPVSEVIFAKGDYHTEHKWLGNFGDYDLTKMDNDILVEFHENVNRKNVVKYLPDYDLNTFEELVEEFEDAESMDERESKLFAINDLLGI